MLIIGILITANTGAAIPQGTVIKEGTLTYPAGHYLTEDPLLLSLENYEDDTKTKASGNFSEKADLQCNYLFFNHNCGNIACWSSGSENLWIYPSNLFSIYL